MNPTTNQFHKEERGNALFLILIAVALFAALSYAVTQSGRGGSGGTNRETATINSALLTDFPASVRTSATRMILTGTPSTLINFRYTNLATVPTITSTGVFHTDGGGSVYVAPPSAAVEGTANATNAGSVWRFKAYRAPALGHYIAGIGTVSADAFAFVGVNLATCRAINMGLGFTDPTPLAETVAFVTSPPTVDGDLTSVETEASAGIVGDLVADSTAGVIGDGTTGTSIGKGHAANPQSFACVANAATSVAPYIYYHALIEN